VYVTAQLCSDGKPLPGGAPQEAGAPHFACPLTEFFLPSQPLAAPLVSSCSACVDLQACHASWHAGGTSPLPLCVKVCDLPDSAELQLRGYATCREPGGADTLLGCAAFHLFSRHGRRLKGGQYTVVLAHASLLEQQRPPPHGAVTRAKAAAEVATAVATLAAAERGVRRYHRMDGHAPRLDWLDSAALPRVQDQLGRARRTCVDAGLVLLTFTLPRHGSGAVLFSEGPSPMTSPPSVPAAWGAHQSSVGAYATQLTWFDDVSITGREDPCARRIARLARRLPPLASLALGGGPQHSATPLVPDGQQRRALAACLRAPPSRAPDGQQRELLWTFRWSLRSDPLALPRFLGAVDWTDGAECGAAVAILDTWALPASSAECAALALWLLSPTFEHSAVRAHAATVVLPRASDEDVSDVLLQLVQALRWESLDDSPLATVLVARASQSATLSTWLHWYLTVELADARFSGRAQSTHAALMAACSQQGRAALEAQTTLVAQLEALNSQLVPVRGHARKRECLRQLLSSEPGSSLASLQPPVTWPLDPQLCVDGVVVATATVFKSALAPLRLTFKVAPIAVATAAQPAATSQPPMSPLPPEAPDQPRVSEGGTPRLSSARGEEELMVASSDDEASSPLEGSRSGTPSPPPPPPQTVTSPGGTPLDGATGAAAAAAEALAGAMHSLSDLGLAAASAAADGWASLLPSTAADAEASSPSATSSVAGGALSSFGGQFLAAAHAVVSAVSPSGHSSSSSGQPHSVTLIYKQGDDLRQDQLCLQFVRCVDRLLKRDGLDLRLTPYRVLATSPTSGLVQFVPGAVTCSGVLAEHRTLLRFFAAVAPDATNTPLGCSASVYETFLRSCAGYCVITYLLGVGDRHLDNLMLCPDGRLFHIDFGYLFGRDPKQWLGAPPPAMKLSKELTDAMGGTGLDSPGWGRFRTLACEAFSICRKHAPQLAALLRPMGQAAMRDVTPEAALRVEAKLELELSAEEATARFAQLLTDSASAALEGLKENVHRVAQYLR
jgi:phosphatidylinositol 3-kinase